MLKREQTKLFQSTLPAWGATYDIYSVCTFDDISIHAPRMGSDVRGKHILSIG